MRSQLRTSLCQAWISPQTHVFVQVAMGVRTTILCKLRKVIAHICNLYVEPLRNCLVPIVFVCFHIQLDHVMSDHTPGPSLTDGMTDPSFWIRAQSILLEHTKNIWSVGLSSTPEDDMVHARRFRRERWCGERERCSRTGTCQRIILCEHMLLEDIWYFIMQVTFRTYVPPQQLVRAQHGDISGSNPTPRPIFSTALICMQLSSCPF